jgi:DNA-binding NarL/FixJ family response regulator
LKRVLVVQSEHLLGAGILHLLNREMDMHVFNTTCDNPGTLFQQIKDIQPAVLVVEENSHLTDHPSFFSLLSGYPDLRVILIDERNNRMQIFNTKEVVIERSTDLLLAIREEEQIPSGGNGPAD